MAKKSKKVIAQHMEPHGEPGHSSLLERNLPVLSRSMTFARMVQADRAFLRGRKDLEWLFPPVPKGQEAPSQVLSIGDIHYREELHHFAHAVGCHSTSEPAHIIDRIDYFHLHISNVAVRPWGPAKSTRLAFFF